MVGNLDEGLFEEGVEDLLLTTDSAYIRRQIYIVCGNGQVRTTGEKDTLPTEGSSRVDSGPCVINRTEDPFEPLA
jgi:hypothetical protein